MTGSQTLGVRIPEHVLVGVDRFAREKGLTRSMAIAVLVERALSEIGMASEVPPPRGKATESGAQDAVSGRRAQQWGTRTAREIAAVLGAEKAGQPQANEFLLDGKRVAIKCAKPKTTKCGLTNTMRDRVDYIICAAQTAGGMFNLYKVTPGQWEKNATHLPKHLRNHGTQTHLSRSVWRSIGEDLGEVKVDG